MICSHALTFIDQVKTNEDAVPWDPKQEDQKVTRRNAQKGVSQLQNDALRFMELYPDLRASNNIIMNLRLAFPLAPRTQCDRDLTREDFDEENSESLLRKCGIPTNMPNETPHPTVASDYQRIITRYVGLHSTVPSKTASESFCNSLSALGKYFQFQLTTAQRIAS